MVALDPFARFLDVHARARAAGSPEPDAAALATSSLDGAPSARMVLMRGIREGGFTFFTHLESRKARELHDNPRAALCFFWVEIREQVRVEGRVVPISAEEADRYWASRPRGHQLSGWASEQSRPIDVREILIARREALRERYEGSLVPRPPFWSGFVLVPERIEFWIARDNRFHERELYTRAGAGWTIETLQP